MSISLQTPWTITPLTWPSSAPFSHFNIKSSRRTLTSSSLTYTNHSPSILWTFVARFGQLPIHNGNNNYKLLHIGKLQVEKAVGSKISMRLPCRALIDGRALDCQYITIFMPNGKFIDVFTASRCRRRRPSSSITPSPSSLLSSVMLLPLPTTTSSSIRVIAVAVAVRHQQRCPSVSLQSPLLSAFAVVVHP